ncbi:MAG: hypothetical protein FWD32_01925 [Firmicutes bacterium]|nr:hypothetical protein [Bacillota bacterium]
MKKNKFLIFIILWLGLTFISMIALFSNMFLFINYQKELVGGFLGNQIDFEMSFETKVKGTFEFFNAYWGWFLFFCIIVSLIISVAITLLLCNKNEKNSKKLFTIVVIIATVFWLSFIVFLSIRRLITLISYCALTLPLWLNSTGDHILYGSMWALFISFIALIQLIIFGIVVLCRKSIKNRKGL